MLSSSKIGGAIFFSKRSRVNEWQPVTTGTFHANGYCTEAQPEIVFVIKST